MRARLRCKPTFLGRSLVSLPSGITSRESSSYGTARPAGGHPRRVIRGQKDRSFVPTSLDRVALRLYDVNPMEARPMDARLGGTCRGRRNAGPGPEPRRRRRKRGGQGRACRETARAKQSPRAAAGSQLEDQFCETKPIPRGRPRMSAGQRWGCGLKCAKQSQFARGRGQPRQTTPISPCLGGGETFAGKTNRAKQSQFRRRSATGKYLTGKEL